MDATLLIGLLQPSPETFELFDDVREMLSLLSCLFLFVLVDSLCASNALVWWSTCPSTARVCCEWTSLCHVGQAAKFVADFVVVTSLTAATFAQSSRCRFWLNVVHARMQVMLLSEGRIVFHGPREAVMPFFQGMGFECPVRRG